MARNYKELEIYLRHLKEHHPQRTRLIRRIETNLHDLKVRNAQLYKGYFS